MAKLTLFDLASGSFTVDLLNANFTAIEAAFENTLSRDGTTPNTMSANLDMNSNRILNIPSAVQDSEPVSLGQLKALSTLVLYTPSNHSHTWAEVSGKPTSFAPSAHVHAKTDVTGLSTDIATLSSSITTLNLRPRVWVQSSAPSTPATNDVWLW